MDEEKFAIMLANRIIDYQARPLSTALMFWNNRNELKKKKDGTQDKKYHARANAQAGQIFDIPTALVIDYGREFWDLIRKNSWDKEKEITFKQVWDDCKRDIEADNYGLMQGLLNPLENADDILDLKWLKNLNKKSF